jgi:hypothetical protein
MVLEELVSPESRANSASSRWANPSSPRGFVSLKAYIDKVGGACPMEAMEVTENQLAMGKRPEDEISSFAPMMFS